MHHNCFKKIIYPNEAYIQRYVNLKNHILFITLDIYMDTHTHTHIYLLPKVGYVLKMKKIHILTSKYITTFYPKKGHIIGSSTQTLPVYLENLIFVILECEDFF